MNLEAIDQLLQVNSIYNTPTTSDNQLFKQAMQVCYEWHLAHNPSFANLNLPLDEPIPVGLFKQINLSTVQDAPSFSSSGTSGQTTQITIDANTMQRIFAAQVKMFDYWQVLDQRPANFLILAPDPQLFKEAGYAYTFTKMTACAPIQEVVYGCQADLKLDTDLITSTLAKWEKTDSPIYVLGLTVLFEHWVLKQLVASHYQGHIRMITGGGWKGFTQVLDRSSIVASLKTLFPQAQVQIHDLFGMTEHPLHYLSCTEQHFHFPLYSRFEVLNPSSEITPEGEIGLIRLQNPFSTSIPCYDLLTNDLGTWHTGCQCGLPTPYLNLLGRKTTSEDTCAYRASQT